jgi:predicted transcriptional regulator
LLDFPGWLYYKANVRGAAMASQESEILLSRVETVVGRATATAFVTPDKDERHFVITALLTAAALFLMNRYFSGFFKPVEEAGVQHRKVAIELLKELANGDVKEPVSKESLELIEKTLAEAKALNSPERRLAAEESVQQILRDYGESAAEASRKAKQISEAIFDS